MYHWRAKEEREEEREREVTTRRAREQETWIKHSEEKEENGPTRLFHTLTPRKVNHGELAVTCGGVS